MGLRLELDDRGEDAWLGLKEMDRRATQADRQHAAAERLERATPVVERPEAALDDLQMLVEDEQWTGPRPAWQAAGQRWLLNDIDVRPGIRGRSLRLEHETTHLLHVQHFLYVQAAVCVNSGGAATTGSSPEQSQHYPRR